MQPTSFNPYPIFAERLTPDNAALLLLDHQTGISIGIGDMSQDTFKNNALAVAKIGQLFKLPTILTTSYEDGPNGPLMPEILAMYPDAPYIKRPGEISAWDNPEFKQAVEATGRRKLIMAGVTTDVCLLFPAIAAVAEGYDVYAIIDASGTWNNMVQLTAVLRLQQAGVKVCNWVSVSAELLGDWQKPNGQHVAQLYSEHLIYYGNLMKNFQAAQAQPAQA